VKGVVLDFFPLFVGQFPTLRKRFPLFIQRPLAVRRLEDDSACYPSLFRMRRHEDRRSISLLPYWVSDTSCLGYHLSC
jgi:hypothetical protein